MKETMHFLFFFVCLSLVLTLAPFSIKADVKGVSIDDLLHPEVSSMKNKIEDKQKLSQERMKEKNLDELLGPKDIFPFLPDNHRDSGTGKFNSF